MQVPLTDVTVTLDEVTDLVITYLCYDLSGYLNEKSRQWETTFNEVSFSDVAALNEHIREKVAKTESLLRYLCQERLRDNQAIYPAMLSKIQAVIRIRESAFDVVSILRSRVNYLQLRAIKKDREKL